jgi:hypothetical protein
MAEEGSQILVGLIEFCL